MKIGLADNIRKFRKERSMTQEQLAEAMGVSIGAVHKWETGLSVPEIGLIIKLADFYDTSVDVLLGYEMKDNHVEAMEKRLVDYFNRKNRDGLEEAEKALAKYPNSFRIVRVAAELYMGFGLEDGDRTKLKRSIELFETAERLFSQNTDTEISLESLQENKAVALFRLGEVHKAVEMLIKDNTGGCHNSLIGVFISVYEKDPERAAPYLSKALFGGVNGIMNITPGYVMLYVSRKDYEQAEYFTEWVENIYKGLQKGDRQDFMDKTISELYVMRAYVFHKKGDRQGALHWLKEAYSRACKYDSDPGFDIGQLRFCEIPGVIGTYDMAGESAQNGIREVVRIIDDKEFGSLWKEAGENNETGRDLQRTEAESVPS